MLMAYGMICTFFVFIAVLLALADWRVRQDAPVGTAGTQVGAAIELFFFDRFWWRHPANAPMKKTAETTYLIFQC